MKYKDLIMKHNLPDFIRETVEHVKTCEQIVKDNISFKSDDEYKALVNLYKKFSSHAADVTADRYFAQKKGEKLENTENRYVKLSTLKLKMRITIKVFLNKAFLFFGHFSKDKFVCDKLVRTWVDVTYELYEKDIDRENTLFVVYPFSINRKRQIDYIKFLKSKGIKYVYSGYNYAFTDLLKWLLGSDDADLAALENNANERHADFLLNRIEFNQLLTTDEFEVSSFILNRKIKNAGKKVINKAHGVGKYSPFVCYDEFWVFNSAQRNYYGTFSPEIIFQDYPVDKPTVVESIKHVVLVSQQLTGNNESVADFENRVLKELSCTDKYKVCVKLHPNSKIEEHVDASGIEYFKTNPDYMNNSVFLTAYSTAYLTFQKFGTTYLVGDALNDPSLVFGREARIIDIDSLKEFINGL